MAILKIQVIFDGTILYGKEYSKNITKEQVPGAVLEMMLVECAVMAMRANKNMSKDDGASE